MGTKRLENGRFLAKCVVGAVCASLLSGRYPRHIPLEANLRPGEAGLPTTVPTLPRWLKEASPPFATALFGKWYGRRTSAEDVLC